MSEPLEIWAVIASDGFVIGAFDNRTDAERHVTYCDQLKPIAPPHTCCRYVVPEPAAMGASVKAEPIETGRKDLLADLLALERQRIAECTEQLLLLQQAIDKWLPFATDGAREIGDYVGAVIHTGATLSEQLRLRKYWTRDTSWPGDQPEDCPECDGDGNIVPGSGCTACDSTGERKSIATSPFPEVAEASTKAWEPKIGDRVRRKLNGELGTVVPHMSRVQLDAGQRFDFYADDIEPAPTKVEPVCPTCKTTDLPYCSVGFHAPQPEAAEQDRPTGAIRLEIVCMPGRCGGRPTLGDSRLTLAQFVSQVRAGWTETQLHKDWPHVSMETWRVVWAIAQELRVVGNQPRPKGRSF